MIQSFSDRLVLPLARADEYLMVVDMNLCPMTSLAAAGPAFSRSLLTKEIRNECDLSFMLKWFPASLNNMLKSLSTDRCKRGLPWIDRWRPTSGYSALNDMAHSLSRNHCLPVDEMKISLWLLVLGSNIMADPLSLSSMTCFHFRWKSSPKRSPMCHR